MPRVLSDAMVSSSPDTHLTLATTPVRAAGRVARLASGMRRDVADHGVRVAALGVQVGVGVVFRDAPEAVLLVPPSGPPQMVRQEEGDPRGVRGRWQDGRARLTRRAWPRRRACGRPR